MKYQGKVPSSVILFIDCRQSRHQHGERRRQARPRLLGLEGEGERAGVDDGIVNGL